MAGSDIKAKRITSGAASIGRARMCQLVVTVNNTGAGRLTITDGNGGATVFDADLSQNLTHMIDLCGDGILVTDDVYASTVTNITSLTILYR